MEKADAIEICADNLSIEKVYKRKHRTRTRSKDMTLFQIRVPKDDAWDVMNVLGELDVAHFINLNKSEQPFNLPYAN